MAALEMTAHSTAHKMSRPRGVNEMRYGIGLMTLALAFSAYAAKPLQVIELGDDRPVSSEDLERGRKALEAQQAAANIPPSEALDFAHRLVNTVEDGLAKAKRSSFTGKAARDQSIALNKLHEESTRFSGLLAPFASCNSAASYASLAWTTGLAGDADKAAAYHTEFEREVVECAAAAKG